MKGTILLMLATCTFISTFGQQKEEAEKVVQEGIAYHDKGDYDGAITRYDKALELDKDNLLALTEKSMTLLAQQKYDDVVDICKRTIKVYSGDKGLPNLYVTYGTALDGLKKTDDAINIYDKGLKSFPNNYQLHFNKGITLSNVRKYDEALLSFEAAATLAPQHASSQNAIARIQAAKNRQVPSLLAYWRFFALEPQSARAKANLPEMLKVIKGNVEQKDEKTINVSLFLDDSKGKKKENDFGTTQMILSLSAALDYDEKYKNETEVQKFLRKFETVCSSLKESSKEGKGFYWTYYAPYFIGMKDEKHLETFAYIVFSSSEDAEVAKWLEANSAKVKEFYTWSKTFLFKTNQ